MFSTARRQIGITIALSLISISLFAGNDPGYSQTLFGKNGQLQANTPLYTYDINYEVYKNTSGAIEKTWYVKNAVRFMIDEESSWNISSDFIASIVLNITTENAAGTITNLPQKTLTIDYKIGEGLISGSISTYAFRDAVKVTVTIASAVTKNVSWDVTKNLKLVNEIISLRDWGFNCSNTTITGIITDSLFADEWKVKWNVSNNFQTEYDLEWAWIDESAVENYTYNNAVNLDSVFDNNATRVTTSNNYYRIPLLYEDNGRIYARVRMAQVKVNGQRVEGNWYYLSDGGLAYLQRIAGQGHEDNLNWQATTTFAEEGKRKTVVQYFDGSLRGRQIVTKDNVNKTTVVAESFYDYQGRPVIQVLPSPTLNTIIQFTKNFNQFDDTRNAKTVYDKLDVNQSSCNKLTAKMLNTVTGSAAQYYSANNPQVNDGFNKYIPDAAGYPYTETRYTNDGTGRIDAQGGVGPLFQVNSGRETKYYYESADQDDLDALFGTDAGYASHYSKNWVRDANGQYSISYVDMRGKTVATALAGDTVTNLRALPSFATASKTITRQLIDKETNNVHGNSIISSKSLMVAKPGNYAFNYYLSPEKLKMMLCTGTQFCFDCLYELNISIIPDCSDKVIANFTNPVVKKNFNPGEYLTSCTGNNSPLVDTIFNVWLEEGAYTIVKELKMSTAARDWYRENVYITNDTCKRKIDFILQQYQLALNQQNCYLTCTQCNTKLGTLSAFVDSFKVHSGLSQVQVDAMMKQIEAAYYEAKANCDRICDNSNEETLDELTSIKEIMLQDMTPPMGQYARLNDSENPTNINKPYNIFNPSPLVNYCSPVKKPYQYPVTYNLNPGTVSCLSGYQNQYGIVNLTKEAAAAMNEETFTDNFEDSYAYNLLPYHPEFCKLKFAETNLKGTYRFGGRLQNTDTWTLAVSRGFINTATSDATAAANYLMQKDSFFIKVGINSPYADSMRSKIILNFVASKPLCNSPSMGMWKVAKLFVFCHKEMGASANQQPDANGCFTPSPNFLICFNALNNLPPSPANHCDADMNMVWKNFKALYTSYRSILINQYLTNNCSINYSIFNTNSGFNYHERFNRLQHAPPYSLDGNDLDGLLNSTDPQAYAAVMAAEADSICRASSGNWINRLRRCPQVDALAETHSAQWVADSVWLSKYLVDVCRPGVDYMGHPFGASSLPDGNPPQQLFTNPNGAGLSGIFVRNFPDIIRYYLQFRFGTNSINQFCYPELIDYPKAYNVAPPTVITPVITVPPPCSCERINYYKIKWQNAGSPGTFSNYLLNTQGTSISQDTLNILLQMCTTGYTSANPNCNFLMAPIKLPAIFQCRGTANLDSSKTCITCADYTELKQKFLTERGVPAPYNNPQTTTELAWNRAFAEFANYRTGFSKLWPEYIQFGIVCANDSTLSCTNLTSLVAAWQATNPPQSGDSCRNSFTQYMNYHTGRNLTFNQWMDEFVKACGARPPVCLPVLTCSRFGSLINSYYMHYGYQIWRNSNCQTLFVNFINDSLYTSYTYQDIVNNYNYLCGSGCPLNLCSFPNSHLLTLLYNNFKRYVYQNWWSLNQCQSNFVSWFNTQLGFTQNPYTWEGIVALYQLFTGEVTCVPDINQLCAPPYSCAQFNYILQLFYAQYPGADTLSNCQALLTAFFNQQLNTNYTFNEIKALYLAICGTVLPSCQGGIIWDCKEMILLTQDIPCSGDRCVCFTILFNSHYGTNYTYEQIRQLYLDHCDFVLNICPLETPVFTCELLQNTLNSFNIKYPGGGSAFGADCRPFFAAYFNNSYTTAYSYTYINNLYLVQCGDSLHVCESKCGEYIAFVNSHINRYGNFKIPLAARRQLFAFMFNNAFGYTGSSELNQPLVYSQIKALMTGCLTMPASLESENLYLTLNDANVLRDYKTAYYLLHPGGVPVDCQTDFTAWINWTLGVNKIYCELVDLYNSILGAGAGDICGPSSGCGSSGGGDKGLPIGGGSGGPITYPPMLCGLNIEIFNPPLVDTSTCKDPWLLAVTDATIKWELYLDSLRRNFDVAWHNKCAGAKTLESFTVTFARAEHHYTLYYYDQAGQLVRTVPPEAVEDKRSDTAFLNAVKAARSQYSILNTLVSVLPTHTLTTDYRYNTLGQVVQQKSPDGGLSKFWYDKLGRLVVSQNQQQATGNQYSYTIYDLLGRIQEVGQKPQTTTMTQTISRSESSLNSWLTATANREQITRTVYDVSYFDGDDILKPYPLVQRNLRNRVSYTHVFDVQPDTWVGKHRAATYYTYDIHGNVDTLLQDYGSSAWYNNVMNSNGNRYKKIAYNYDLISGKVNLVTYQPGYINPLTNLWVNNADRFYHRYSYDAENKLTMAETSHDSLIWERDATYSYYRHGPLARTVLGQQQVQGTDYAYTLQGGLKGINSTSVSDGSFDMGGDGKIGGVNSLVARDAYGFSLNYYQTTINGVQVSDYKSINANVNPFVTVNNANANTGKQLFNGNISSMVVNIPKLGDAKVYQYGYDQLQRLLAVDVFEGVNNSNNSFTPALLNDYKERLTYSANGNINTYLRNGTGGTMNLNNYTYSYQSGTNKLASIINSVNAQTKTYSYDAIGNTIADGMQGATNIVWTVYGKVRSCTNTQGQQVSYTYSADGQRISKKVDGVEEYYVRDASGNIMATYTKSSAINNGDLTVTEWYKYGSSLLSINTRQVNVQNAVVTEITTEQRGYDGYILTDHLGNTRAVVTDRKLQYSSNGTTVDYYIADVKSATYYSSYGATAKSYNQQPIVAFNGQRKSAEIGSDAQTALFWEYNGDVGRRWNIDPKPNIAISPYNCFAGNPIFNNDILGDTLNFKHINDKNIKSSNALVNDLAAKTGLTLKVDDKTGLLSYGTENGKAKISTDDNGKLVGSKSAREELIKMIESNQVINVKDGSGQGSRVEMVNQKKGQEKFTNNILIDNIEMNSAIKHTSKDLNSTTFGYALTFFHERGHTIYGGEHLDPTEVAGPNERLPNKIRRELGKEYGQRLVYFGVRVNNGPQLMPFTSKALKDMKNGKQPTGGFVIIYNPADPEEKKKMENP